jgi:Uncharacterized protein conserved in bacteria (DUF2252)
MGQSRISASAIPSDLVGVTDPGCMDIQKATREYEAWLAARIPLIQADLDFKHQRMNEGAFPFLRATFYRWVQVWPQVCPELAEAPVVLGVGDLHVENFGTWRDSEGRLIWGVNDFDEACRLPYANDLVRLAASAALAVQAKRLSCDPADLCGAILAGYQESLEEGGRPFVLAEQHRWLRDLAMNDLRDPTQYWDKLEKLRTAQGIPPAVRTCLIQALPERSLSFRVVHRRAGLGSLGRRRFTALADWRGGEIAREAKELFSSAWSWEKAKPRGQELFYQAVLDRAMRVPDPMTWIAGHWLLRRLAPDCSRIELSTLPRSKDELRLARAMGWETGNVHLGTKGAARSVLADLKKRPAGWLDRAVEAMTKSTVGDWKAWVESSRSSAH